MNTQGQQLIFAPGKAIMERSAGQKQKQMRAKEVGMQMRTLERQATAHRLYGVNV